MTRPASGGPLTWTPTSQTQLASSQLMLAANRVEDIGTPAVTSVVGSWGLGKTTLVDREVHAHYKAPGRRVLRLQLQAAPKPNEMLVLLLRQLGVKADVPGYLLRELLVDHLADVRSVIVVDEAHHMGTDPLRGCKVLIDALPMTDWILIGTDELPDQLSRVPELRDRVSFPISIKPLTLTEVLQTIPTAHPLLEDAPPELIAHVNEDFAHGRWRPWRDFTGAAVQIAARANAVTLTHQIASAAITAAGGPRPSPNAPARGRRRRAA